MSSRDNQSTAVATTRLALILVMVSAVGVSVACAESRAPLVTVSVAGINRLIDDLEYISELSDRPRIAEAPRALLVAVGGLEGIDRSRPAGLMLFVHDPPSKDPDGLVAIPVSDRTGFMELLKKLANITVVSTEGDSRQTLIGASQTFHLHWVNEYVLIAESPDLVDCDAAMAFPVRLAEASTSHDGLVTLHRSGIPEQLLQKAKRELPAKIRRDAEWPEDESEEEKALRSRLLDLVIKAGLLLLEGIEEVSFSVNVSPDVEGVRLSGQVGAITGSELSQVLENLPGSGQSYGEFRKQSALMLQWNFSFPRLVRELLTDGSRLGAREWEAEVGVSLKIEDREPLRSALQAFVQTLQEGQVRGMLGFVVDRDSRVAILLSEYLAGPGAFEEALLTLIPYAQKGGDLREVELRAATANGAAVHRIQGKPGREQDAKLFGGDPSLYLTFTESASWLGVGTPSALEALQTAVSGVRLDVEDRSLMRGELHVHPWIALIAAESQDKLLVSALQEAFPHIVPNRLAAELNSSAHGLDLEIRADESFLHFLGIALSHDIDN